MALGNGLHLFNAHQTIQLKYMYIIIIIYYDLFFSSNAGRPIICYAHATKVFLFFPKHIYQMQYNATPWHGRGNIRARGRRRYAELFLFYLLTNI